MSEIEQCKLYLANEGRWQQELEREEKKLRWQQERVDRLRARRGETGEQRLDEWYSKLSDLRERLLVVKNQAAIEQMLRLQRQLDELNAVPGTATPALAACDQDSPEATEQLRLECDACGFVLVTEDGELDGTPCPGCRDGVMTESEASDE